MQRKPLFIFAFLAICAMAVGGGNAIRKAMDPSIAGTENPLFASLGKMIRGTVTARLGYGVADAANPKQVKRGALVYRDHCASCHGAKLEGEPNWRQRNEDGTLPAPPHDATGHTWHHGDDQLFSYTKKGGKAMAGPSFKSNMPAFEGVLSDSDIWSVLAFIKSRWPDGVQRRQATLNKSN
ncbi:MAG: cytochrome c [Magnetovibrio sp.]|nr:cytochrome c [Magnetovibrio sp.]